MTPKRAVPDPTKFNSEIELPYELRLKDFELAMQDVYDFFFDVNGSLSRKGLPRFDDMLRPAAMSGIISDMLTGCLARHSRTLVENGFHNGHPDLIVGGRYPNDAVQSGEHGVEVKSTRKKGGAVDTHGAREQWMCVFVYGVDATTEPASARAPMEFHEVYQQSVDNLARAPRAAKRPAGKARRRVGSSATGPRSNAVRSHGYGNCKSWVTQCKSHITVWGNERSGPAGMQRCSNAVGGLSTGC